MGNRQTAQYVVFGRLAECKKKTDSWAPTVLAELEACSFRNKTPAETAAHMKPLLDKYLPLDSNSSASKSLFSERQKDHYSHFILRLAFASTEDLRRRFARVETMLFRLRLNDESARERAAFVQTLDLDWESVTEEEKAKYREQLAATGGQRKGGEEESWFKVDWERVPDLVDGRRVFLKAGKAYVPSREQTSMIVAEFTGRLERALEVRLGFFVFCFFFFSRLFLCLVSRQGFSDGGPQSCSPSGN